MAVFINEECINCGACADECPNMAILTNEKNPTGADFFFVIENKCTECDGGDMACISVCPSDAIHKR